MLSLLVCSNLKAENTPWPISSSCYLYRQTVCVEPFPFRLVYAQQKSQKNSQDMWFPFLCYSQRPRYAVVNSPLSKMHHAGQLILVEILSQSTCLPPMLLYKPASQQIPIPFVNVKWCVEALLVTQHRIAAVRKENPMRWKIKGNPKHVQIKTPTRRKKRKKEKEKPMRAREPKPTPWYLRNQEPLTLP